MAKVLITEAYLGDIADAIREKNGSANTYTPGQMAAAISAIQTGIETMTVSFDQENEAVQTYLTNSESYPTAIASRDYSSTAASALRDTTTYRKDQPVGASVSVPSGTLYFDGREEIIDEDDATFVNLVPGKQAPFVVVDSGIEAVGLVSPSGQVRMIKADSLYNIRDLGGWQGDGGRVKYGKIFRGCDVRETNGDGYDISQTDKQLFKQRLGIRAEIDFTYDSFSESGIGPDVAYYPTTIGSPYKPQIDIDAYYTQTKAAIEAIFDCVKKGLPCYFHCTLGADRTGTVAFILLALLGVNLRDCDRDYELTYAWDTTIPLGTRIRTYGPYKEMVEYLIACGGTSLAQCAASWCSLAGISMTDVNDFRAAMIDGTPSQLSPAVNYNTANISLSSSQGTVDAGDDATITVTRTPSWSTSTITASSSDTSVATVAVSGNVVTVHGQGNGSATITVSCNGHTATYTVTVAEAIPVVNQITISTDESGNVYNGTGYKTASRINSSGNVVDHTSGTAQLFVTGFIPVQAGDVLRFYNCFQPQSVTQAEYGTTSIGTFNNGFYAAADKSFLSKTYWSQTSSTYFSAKATANSVVVGYTCAFTGFVRLTMAGDPTNAAITINQEM